MSFLIIVLSLIVITYSFVAFVVPALEDHAESKYFKANPYATQKDYIQYSVAKNNH